MLTLRFPGNIYMIHEIRNAVPAIDFGFGTTDKEAAPGEEVTIWLQTLYNQEAYEFALQCSGTITPVSNYEYRVCYGEPGIYPIQLVVSTTGKTKSLVSNTLNLNVVNNG